MRDWTRGLARKAPAAPVKAVRPLGEVLVGLLEGGTSVDAQRLKEVGDLLALSPTGTSDVRLMAAESIRVTFDTREGGACYRPRLRTIVINRTQVAARTATDFIHEATHARLHLEGRAASIVHDDREDFAANMIADETTTYMREAEVGRELLHALVRLGRVEWKQLMTIHPMQMWFQLVHGVAYHQLPDERVRALDASLNAHQLAAVRQHLRPTFSRYVEPYRRVEKTKWDIFHGERPPQAPEVISGVLSMLFEDLPQRDKFPVRNGISFG